MRQKTVPHSVKTHSDNPGTVRGKGVAVALFVFLLALTGCLLLAPKSKAADAGGAGTTTEKVKIDLAHPKSIALIQVFDGNADTVEIPLSIGNDPDPAFVIFDGFPAGVSLSIKEAWNDYRAGEQIEPGKWYWFRPQAPLILTIKSSETSRIMLTFWTTALDDKQKADAGAAAADKMREFTENAHLTKQGDPFTIVFNRKGGPTPNPTPIVVLEGDPPFVAFFTNHLLRTLLIGVGLLVLIFLIYAFGRDLKDYLVDKIRHGRRIRYDQGKRQKIPIITTGGGMYDDFSGKTSPQVVQTPKPKENEFSGVGDNRPPLPSPTGSAINQQALDSIGQSIKALTQSTNKSIEELKRDLTEKVDRSSYAQLAQDISSLQTKQTNFQGSVGKVSLEIQKLTGVGNDQKGQIERNYKEITGSIRTVTSDLAKVFDHFGELSSSLTQAESRMKQEIANIRAEIDRQVVPPSYYTKTLSLVLGQNVEPLLGGNFERLMSEKLNQFFQTGVQRGEGLDDLRIRAQSISTALANVTSLMAKAKPSAGDAAGPQARRAEKLSAEIVRLQSELQNRRITIETSLNFPVSLHPGARQTFLDDLSRGLLREVDKLSSPEDYFEGELGRFIASDLIATVDICDKSIAQPGTRVELETAFKNLFEQSNLRPILPRQGEPFKASEQDLIEMIQSGGSSLTIAEVATRGFYYTHRGNQTLLRKAGVKVYR